MAYVQTLVLTPSGATITGTLTVMAGSTLVVFAGGLDSITGVSDGINVYDLQATSTIQDSVICKSWVVKSAAGGSTTITVTFDGFSGFHEGYVMEFSGRDTTAPVDVQAGWNNANSASSLASSSAATINTSSCDVVAFTYQTSRAGVTISVGSGFSNFDNTHVDSAIEQKGSVLAGSFTATFGASVNGFPFTTTFIALKAAPANTLWAQSVL